MNFTKLGFIKLFNAEANFSENLNNLLVSVNNVNYILYIINTSENIINIENPPPNIKVFNKTDNKTLSIILNEYINLMFNTFSDIDLITFIDDGVVITKDWLPPIIESFKKYPRLSIASPSYCNITNSKKDIYRNWWFADNTILPIHITDTTSSNTFLPLFKKSAFTISRDSFNIVGDFNTSFKYNLFDVDYSIRVTSNDLRIISCINSLVIDTNNKADTFLSNNDSMADDLIAYSSLYTKHTQYNKIQPLTAVECQIYNQDHLLEAWLKNVHKYVDEIIILYSKEPWNHNPNAKDNALDVDDSYPILEKYLELYPNLNVFEGNWKDETLERNYGLDFAKSIGAKWLLIIDCDELYDADEIFTAYKFMINNPTEIWVMNSIQLVKEKNLAALPKEGYPLCNFAINLESNVRFLATRIVAGKSILIPYEICKCWHFSYLLPKEKLEQKLNTSFHFIEFNNNWYTKVWPFINISSVDCHPTHPDAWHTMYNIDIPKSIFQDIKYLN